MLGDLEVRTPGFPARSSLGQRLGGRAPGAGAGLGLTGACSGVEVGPGLKQGLTLMYLSCRAIEYGSGIQVSSTSQPLV